MKVLLERVVGHLASFADTLAHEKDEDVSNRLSAVSYTRTEKALEGSFLLAERENAPLCYFTGVLALLCNMFCLLDFPHFVGCLLQALNNWTH